MNIEELTRDACLAFLARSHFGRIACSKDSQPYITPFYFTYHDHKIHSFATVGQKIEWLRVNPLACVEVDEIKNSQHWTSVIVLGTFEEILETADRQPIREQIYELLQQRPLWWESGYAKTILHGTLKPLTPVYFRIAIQEITGRRATQD